MLARDCWGLGYATGAGRACLEHGFTSLGAARIAAVIQHASEQSQAVAHRLGMERREDIRTANGFDCQLWVVERETEAAPD